MQRSLKIVLFILAISGSVASAIPEKEQPPLSSRTIDGKSFRLADLSGDVVIVNFWATWCAPCRIEMPALDGYYRAHRHEGLAMLAISVEPGVSVRKLQRATAGYAFAISRVDDTDLARSAIPVAIPETRIYGRDGRLRSVTAGSPLTPAQLERIVTPLLHERGATIR